MQQNPNYIIHDKIFEFYFLHKYVSRRLIILKNYGSNYYFFKFRENENVQKRNPKFFFKFIFVLNSDKEITSLI